MREGHEECFFEHVLACEPDPGYPQTDAIRDPRP